MRSVTTFFSLAAYASVELRSLQAPNDAQAWGLPAAPALSHYLQNSCRTHLYLIFTTIKKKNYFKLQALDSSVHQNTLLTIKEIQTFSIAYFAIILHIKHI